ncbi:hypothetical protein D9Q98_004446 [Chlorella vulgaris]|uniref:SPX domain-containing protein n=1 Tax=Chlorella vulgaris TaxID=3077 RepID=A0A9D4TPV9_CHLVU|nr:hypothetical protein D9Q98_004446 [Chlorella vulgaris]
MRFGRSLASQAHPGWRQHYLDYDALKQSIKACAEAQRAAAQQQGPPLSIRALLEDSQAKFQSQLDAEVLKVIGFYQQHSAQLLEEVDRASEGLRQLLRPDQQEQAPRSADKAAALESSVEQLEELIVETTQLLQYVSLNMTAIRKALKKYAKNVVATNQPVSGFLALEIEHPNDPGWRVLQGTFLPAAVAQDLHDMQEHEDVLAAMARLQQLVRETEDYRRRLTASASMRMTSGGERQLGALADHVVEMVAAQQDAARDSALVHAVPWLERAAGMFEPAPADEFAVATVAGLVLNNLSTLLFLANYTAVLPPTDALCVRIGVSSSYTGLIMAASDLAAVVASLGISFWTQHSFKQPLLFASLSCLAGNLLFVAAYQWRSLTALLIARLLNGLGSARTANRRYTADYVSRSRRTAASAAFVGASNLGMALGPLLSLPLAYLPDRQVAGLSVNSITAVGWIMAFLWVLFFAATLIWFPDPPKRLPIGLAPQDDSMSLPAHNASSSKSSQLKQPLLTAAALSRSPNEAETGELAAHADGDGLASDGALLPHVLAAKQQQQQQARGAATAAVWQATVPATLACTLALFIQKMVQQGLLDSIPLFAQRQPYSWHSSQVGLFIGLLCAAMVPVNLSVGAASSRVSDRSMVVGSLAMCVVALLALTRSAASAVAFLGGAALLLTASVVLEGTATALMSKVIWSGFATGVLNAGLLSTEAGTLGRLAGNALLWGVGRATGLDDGQLPRFAWLLFATLAALSAMLLVHLACVYGRLKG